jgi:hypothetical protein
MASINAMKKENATVLLADGTDIGAAAENMTYKDLSGMMGNMMRYLVSNFIRILRILHFLVISMIVYEGC